MCCFVAACAQAVAALMLWLPFLPQAAASIRCGRRCVPHPQHPSTSRWVGGLWRPGKTCFWPRPFQLLGEVTTVCLHRTPPVCQQPDACTPGAQDFTCGGDKFQDGAVTANNPAVIALQEAVRAGARPPASVCAKLPNPTNMLWHCAHCPSCFTLCSACCGPTTRSMCC